MTRSARTVRAGYTITVLSCAAFVSGGCANGGDGAFSGAALGAAGGAIIGSIFGAPGAGAAIGALSGAVTGGVIGDQNERRDRQVIYESRPTVIEHHYYYEVPPPDPYRNRDRYRRSRGG